MVSWHLSGPSYGLSVVRQPREQQTSPCESKPKREETEMSEQDNITAVRRMYEEVFNQDRPDLVDELAVPNFKNHAAPPAMQDGADALKSVVGMLSTAFPDDRHEIEDIFAYGDRVACRVRFHGT